MTRSCDSALQVILYHHSSVDRVYLVVGLVLLGALFRKYVATRHSSLDE